MNANSRVASEDETGGTPGKSAPADQRLVEAMREYMRELDNGRVPDPKAIQDRHPEIANTLVACMEGIDIVNALAPSFREPGGAADELLPVPGTMRPLGDFLILRQIGRGGMGVVYEAQQLSLDRRVALKVLPFAAAMDPRHLQRFKNEAQAAAHLHHNNIVPIFGVGSERGVHYYAMQFIEGRTLAAVIQEYRRLLSGRVRNSSDTLGSSSPTSALSGSSFAGARTNAEEARLTERKPGEVRVVTDGFILSQAHFRTMATYALQAAEALEYAHQMGVVHRDIKPANLLVDPRGNLWITDFGLAHVRSNAGLTMTGDVMGTLRYMSPEQALARRGLIDHRTDIYSLGVTLYELLSLRPVFEGSDRQELLHQIAFAEPQALQKINPAIPRELETIVLKAIEKNAHERYATARELADDLRCFLEDKPIHAKRPTARERLRKWGRRHRSLVSTMAFAMLIGFVGLALSTAVIWHEKQLTHQALDEKAFQERLASQNALRAMEQRQRAVLNFNREHAVMRRVLLELQDRKWSQFPEINKLRQAVAEDVLGFLKERLQDGSIDPDIQRETGWSYTLMGHVYRAQGDIDKATTYYDKAIGVLANLVKEYPRDVSNRQELALAYHNRGLHYHYSGDTLNARAYFQLATENYAKAIEDCPGAQFVYECPYYRSLNNYAWFLATCPQPEFRDSAKSIELAQMAVTAQDTQSEYWNTLGVARYRGNKLNDALKALERSCSLGGGGNAFDFFFMAMAHFQLGNTAKAKEYYDKAMEDSKGGTTLIEPIHHLRQEARAMMGGSMDQQQNEKSPPLAKGPEKKGE
jgi:serine/threonine protein kinase/Tfp pilus assembly protein PilF